MSGVWASVDKRTSSDIITINSIVVKVNDSVKKYDLIGTVTNASDKKEQVFAPISGIIKEVSKYIDTPIPRFYGDLARIEESEADKKAREEAEKEAREREEIEARKKAEEEARKKARENAEEEARKKEIEKAEEEKRLKYNNLYYSIQFETGDEINYKIYGTTHKIKITSYDSKNMNGIEDGKSDYLSKQYIIAKLVSADRWNVIRDGKIIYPNTTIKGGKSVLKQNRKHKQTKRKSKQSKRRKTNRNK